VDQWRDLGLLLPNSHARADQPTRLLKSCVVSMQDSHERLTRHNLIAELGAYLKSNAKIYGILSATSSRTQQERSPTHRECIHLLNVAASRRFHYMLTTSRALQQ